MRIRLCALALASIIAAAALAQTAPAPTDPQTVLRQMGNRTIGVHDPSTIIKCKDQYYVFITGANTPSFHSADLINWQRGPTVNPNTPAWAAKAVPLNNGRDFWAPEIAKVGDKYMLFFSVSSFGKNTSAIGVSTNSTLDPADPAYKWTDGGIVVQSHENDDFNTIDPTVLLDADGKLWMAFGSFWGGIKLIELDPATGRRIKADSPMTALAHWDSIEAPYLYRHDKYYYLFVSMGMCCRGVNSTYHTRVGRSAAITGPYIDKDGVDMLEGGGTPVLDKEGPYVGPGQVGIVEVEGKSWLSHHFYDGTTPRGTSRLAMRPLTWSADGWPIAGKME